MNRFLPIALLTATLALSSGCVFFQKNKNIEPGNDPFVVYAEGVIQGTFDLADTYVNWVDQNQAVAPQEAKDFAEQVLKPNFPEANRGARALLKTYKANRTPENKANLQTVLKTLEFLKGEIAKRLPTTAMVHTQASAAGTVISAAMVIAAIDGLMKLMALITGWVAQAKRSREWTPEEEDAVAAKMEEAFASPAWQVRTPEPYEPPKPTE